MPRVVDTGARRAALVDAVWAVTARDGLAAATARAVAAEAEVSLGSVTRAFPTQDALHVEAMSRLSLQVQARLVTAAQPRAGDTAPAIGLRLIEQVVPLDDTTHVEAVVYYDYVARARSSATLRVVADLTDAALRRLCDDVVGRLAPDATVDTTRAAGVELHALTEGLAFGLVTWPHLRSRAQARSTIATWLERVGSRA